MRLHNQPFPSLRYSQPPYHTIRPSHLQHGTASAGLLDLFFMLIHKVVKLCIKHVIAFRFGGNPKDLFEFKASSPQSKIQIVQQWQTQTMLWIWRSLRILLCNIPYILFYVFIWLSILQFLYLLFIYISYIYIFLFVRKNGKIYYYYILIFGAFVF